MTRLFVLTFHGPKRWTEDIEHPHESPPVMTIPLILLALGSVVAGLLMKTSVVTWLTPVAGRRRADESAAAHVGPDRTIAAHAGAGRCSAWAWAGCCSATAPRCRSSRPGRWSPRRARNLYGDALNETVFEKPGIYLTRALVYFDNRGLDGVVNGLAALVGGGSGRLRRAQTGFVRTYALSILGGALLVVAAMLAVAVG